MVFFFVVLVFGFLDEEDEVTFFLESDFLDAVFFFEFDVFLEALLVFDDVLLSVFLLAVFLELLDEEEAELVDFFLVLVEAFFALLELLLPGFLRQKADTFEPSLRVCAFTYEQMELLSHEEADKPLQTDWA